MSAAGLVRFRGAAVTFTQTSQTYDATADTMTSSATTVAGYAMRVEGDPTIYKSLGLIQSENPTLEFVPTTSDDVPALGASVTWDSRAFTVRWVDPLGYDGVVTRSRVVVGR